MKNYIAIILLSSALVGCASTTEEDASQAENFCTDSNWTEVGKKVALSGKSVRTYLKYQERCPDLTGANKESYLDGFTVGVKEYCTFENGYEAGDTGKENINVCPLELRAGYDKGYRKGYKNLQANKAEVKRLAEIEQRRKEMDKSDSGR